MTNQVNTLTNQDEMIEAEFKDMYPYEDMSNWDMNLFKSGYLSATKASEQRIQELEAMLAKQRNAIEHAEYLAKSAESLLKYLNDMTDEEECVINPDDRYGDHAATIRSYVYEFRKRAQRACFSGL